MKAIQSNINKVGNFFVKMATSVVSGLPREKIFFKPTKKVNLQNRNEPLRPDSEKHYHRPRAKPVVEKQTLLKENKKAKAAH